MEQKHPTTDRSAWTNLPASQHDCVWCADFKILFCRARIPQHSNRPFHSFLIQRQTLGMQNPSADGAARKSREKRRNYQDDDDEMDRLPHQKGHLMVIRTLELGCFESS
jgi:hypothetical protein